MQVFVHVSEQSATAVIDAVKSFALVTGILAVEGIERLVDPNTGVDFVPDHL
jgi:hypothetical protein